MPWAFKQRASSCMASSGVLVVLTMSTVPLKLNKLANQERFGLERRKIWDQKKKRGQRTKEIEMGEASYALLGGVPVTGLSGVSMQ